MHALNNLCRPLWVAIKKLSLTYKVSYEIKDRKKMLQNLLNEQLVITEVFENFENVG